jgi:energy-converting hydrogenase Eha subunit G
MNMVKKYLFLIAISSTAMSQSRLIEITRDEVMDHRANVPAGCEVIVNAANNNRDIVGAVVGGVIGSGFTARSVAGAAIGAYMSRPSGGGRGSSNP